MAAMTSPASMSSSSAHPMSCLGVSTSTSWMPLAGACTNTGPMRVTSISPAPENAG